MRLALSLLLIGAVAACADPTTSPAHTGATISAYRVIGGPGTGNPPPPPLAVNVVLLTDAGTASTEASGSFNVNGTRDGGTVTVDPSTTGGGGGGFGFAAAAAAPDPSITLIPGSSGGSIVGSGVIVLRFNNDFITVDFARNVRSGQSLISPTCTISPNICALIRFEGAVFTSPASGTTRPVNGYIRFSVPPGRTGGGEG